MGVDCPDITRIISWDPPSTLEDLLQQTGRAGRDGSQSEAILYFRKPVNVSLTMQEYGNNQFICHRRLLYQHFLFSAHTNNVVPCVCCDVCTKLCTCVNCNK